MRYLIDTDICIYIMKKSHPNILKKFEKLNIGEVGMSTITYGELFYGAQKSHHQNKSLLALEEFSNLIPPIPISVEVGKCYGQLRSVLEKKGLPIGNNDLWIAAHAIELKVTLITNNQREFLRIPHLRIENWTK